MGRAMFPPCCLTWGQTMVEVMKIMERRPPSKGPMHALLHSVPPTLKEAIADPGLCWRLQDTHGIVWVSFLWGHCSFLLGPGAHKVLFVPSKSLFLQSCVSFSGSMVGLMATSSNRAYALPRSAAPCSRPLLICTSRRHSDTVLAQSLWVGRVFCVLLRSEQLQRPGAWWACCPWWAVHLNYLSCPGLFVSQVCWVRTISGALFLLCRPDLRLRPSWQMSTV